MDTESMDTLKDNSFMLIKGAFASEYAKVTKLLSQRERPHLPTPAQAAFPQDLQFPETRHAKLRAQILAWNPFIQDYACQARSILNIPQPGIEPGNSNLSESTGLLGIPIHPITEKYLLAGWWLAIHLVKHLYLPRTGLGELPGILPKWIRDYGTIGKDSEVLEERLPTWARNERRFPDTVGTEERAVPINKLSASLVATFALPTRSYDYVRWYVLTGDQVFLKGDSNPLEVEVDAPVLGDGRLVVEVNVKGMDTATVKKDWVEIWDKRIAPLLDTWYVNESQMRRRQEGLELLSGQDLSRGLGFGRRGHKADVKAAKYARFYRYRTDHPHADIEFVRAQFLNEHPEDNILKGGNLETRILMANLKRVEGLMKPLEK